MVYITCMALRIHFTLVFMCFSVVHLVFYYKTCGFVDVWCSDGIVRTINDAISLYVCQKLQKGSNKT